ncbi:cobalt-precorrin-5B (C(1))-methyltransferase CbiD, partial [Klebsiella michiganensis]
LRVMQMLRFTKTPPVCDAIMFSFDNKVLGSNRPIVEIAREMSC